MLNRKLFEDTGVKTHAFSSKSPSYLIESLEWNWGMKKNTLNLDCRKNVFFLSASMHQLYKERKWVLLPDEEIVLQFYKDVFLRDGLEGKEFPNLIEHYIARQGTDGADLSVTIYHNPFNDLPIVSCHVHPKFVILHLGKLLDQNLPTKDSLMEQIPWLKDVRHLIERWMSSHRRPLPSPSWHTTAADNETERISVSDMDTTPQGRIKSYYQPEILSHTVTNPRI